MSSGNKKFLSKVDLATGSISSLVRVGGTIKSIATTAQVNDTGVEGDLSSFSVPANTLGQVGDSLIVEAQGKVGATTNSHSIRLYFGSLTLLDKAITTASDPWHLRAKISRDGTDFIRYHVHFWNPGDGIRESNAQAQAITLTSAQTLRTAALGTASAPSSSIQEFSFLCDFKAKE